VGRWSDWAFYAGVAFLLAMLVLKFVGPEFERLLWALLIAGVVLIAVSAIPWLLNARSTFTGRTARHGLHAALTILFVLGIIGFVEALSYRHGKSIDLTENRRHSLAPQTIQLLRSLTQRHPTMVTDPQTPISATSPQRTSIHTTHLGGWCRSEFCGVEARFECSG
jgi:ABC-type uncharacterized transport system involved in gliding motility auxiliary subunit